jgi:replicative DNA helicase
MKTQTDTERAIIGEVLLTRDGSILKRLEMDEFGDERHKTAWAALKALDRVGFPLDVQSLLGFLKERDLMETAGGAAYVLELEPALTQIMHAESLDTLIAELRLPRPNVNGDYFDWPTVQAEGAAYNAYGKLTGLHSLDRAVKLMPRELVIIGARVRHGKSSLAYNFLLSFLEQYPEETQVFYNLDVPSVVLASRLATIRAKRATGESHAYKNVLGAFAQGTFSGPIFDAFCWLHEQGASKRLAIVNSPRFAVEDIVTNAEHAAREHKLGAIFVDYAELVRSKGRQESEELRLSHTVNTLRIAAEELSCLVVLISQMNRALVTEHGKETRPRLESLRYSGRLEQEATTVLGMYNESAEQLANPNESHDLEDDGHTALQIIPLKNRGGASNRVLRFDFDQVSGNIMPAEEVPF